MSPPRNAWVTIVYDEETFLRALVLAKSLRRVITTADIVVLAHENLPQPQRMVLSEVFDVIVEVVLKSAESKRISSVVPLLEGKIFSWSLTMYNTCVVLDPSIVIVKNCDELFSRKAELSMFKNLMNPNEFLDCVMTLKPSYRRYIHLTTFVSEGRIEDSEPYDLFKILKNTVPYLDIDISEGKFLLSVNSSQCLTTLNNTAVKMWNFDNNKPWLNYPHSGCLENNLPGSFWMRIFVDEVIPYISSGEISIFDEKPFLHRHLQNKQPDAEFTKVDHQDMKDTIAIIGQSCRLPGANNVEEFWELLKSGGDGITSIPLERLQEHQASDPRFTSIKAGFLKCPIDEFDAKFFGISPREAAYMDPQQRLMVEVAWEALEDAALNPSTLKGSNTGVFSGVWTHEYERLLTENTTGRDFHHVVLGNAFSATSARVSYFLGLNGPNVATESGCSSSMVALHLACDSLRKRETDLALATGVNLLIDHFPHSEVSILAKDGHCKTFDEKADGFARAEGVVVVVLKRLSDAVRDGDRIVSIVRGSALSNEGTTTSFGTPSKYCQEIAIKDALKVAGVKPEEVDYVEAHGTGTPIGDPIEFAAISAGYKAQREKPLIIGSVKTNTGHTESAAGLAGLLKVNLAMQNQCIPPHRNLSSVNPNIDLNALPAHIPLQPITWNRNPQRKRLAAVSSFGISGTNVHVILQEPPIIPSFDFQSVNQDRTHHLLTLSAKTENALKDLTQSYAAHLKNHPELSLPDLCYTANVGRTHFKHRLALVAKNCDEMQQKLQNPNLVCGTVENEKLKTVFLFTGQGSQYSCMAKKLYETNFIFRDAVTICENILKNNIGTGIIDVVFNDDVNENTDLNGTIFSQTSIFCIEYGLLKLWESIGIKPDYVLGHSVGEFAASVAAGFMSLEESLTLLGERSRLMNRLPSGGMLAVRTNKQIVSSLMENFSSLNPDEWLDIAVVNSPDELVIAGKIPTLKRFSKLCSENKIKNQFLAASHAFHSRDMDAMLGDFGNSASKINYKSPTCNYVSGSFGKLLQAGDMDSEYWKNHARHDVDFTKGINLVYNQGCNVFIEIGAHPILLPLAMSNFPSIESKNAIWLPSIRKNEENWVTLLENVSKLYVNGMDINWEGLDSCYVRRKIEIPHYVFQRQRYWTENKSQQIPKPVHPLLGRKISIAIGKDHVYENIFNLSDFSYLIDHQVANVIVLPAAGFLEIISAVAKDVFTDYSNKFCIEINDFVVQSPMELEEHKMHKIQVVASEMENRECLFVRVFLFKILNGYNEEKGWQQFANAKVSQSEIPDLNSFNLENAKSRCLEKVSSSEFYKKAFELGIGFGETFQSITNIQKGANECIVEISRPTKAGNLMQYIIHPIVLDAMIQAAGMSMGQSDSDLHLPVAVTNFSIFTNATVFNSTTFSAHAFKNELGASVHLYDEAGNLMCSMAGIRLVKTSIGSFMNVISAHKIKLPGMYHEVWRPRNSHINSRVDLSQLPDLETVEKEVNNRMSKPMKTYGMIENANNICDRSVFLGVQITFRELGWNPKLGDSITLGGFMTDYLLTPMHTMFIERLLGILEEDGFLKRVQDVQEPEWIVQEKPVALKDLVDEFNQLNDVGVDLGEYGNERQIIYYCIGKLADMLLGKVSGVEVLFGNENPDINPLVIYTKGKSVAMANMRVKYFLLSKFENILSHGSIVRILEIGAGSGATSKEILSGLQANGIPFRYTFTDISPIFLEEAKNHFKNFSGVDYKILNIENDPKYQSFIPYSYDVIVAANVLHATENIANCVRNTRLLLAPTGILILQEMLRPVRMIDIIYGTLDGYWKFKDYDLRPNHPCIDKNAWENILLQNGFVNCRLISDKREFTSIIISQATNKNPLYVMSNDLSEEVTTPIWLIFSCSDCLISDSLKQMILDAGDSALIVSDSYSSNKYADAFINYSDELNISTFLASMNTTYSVKGLIILVGLNNDESQFFCKTCLYITKYLASSNVTCKVIVATRGVYSIGDQANMFPNQATIWGVFKSFQTERQDFHCVMVDLDPDTEDAFFHCTQLFSEIWVQDDRLIAFRNNKRYTLRYAKLNNVSSPLDLPKGRYEIVIPTTKNINDVTFKSSTLSFELKSDEVEILVKAAALNFRDILVILKPAMYYTQFEAVGTDFSGVVTKMGKSVSNKYKIGDEVFGISNNTCIASHVVVNSNLILYKPKQFTFAEASTLPSVFLTAYHCLISVGNLKVGETILIHVASGGVGLIAIQIAQALGAKIIATAGNKRKRAYLRSLNISHVFHSRDLTFGENILKVTNGNGVHMVLNSLTGPGFKEASLRVCSENGRFVEMGKVNIWKSTEVAILRPDVKYTIVNLETIDSDEMALLLTAMDDIVKNGQVKPLPYTRFFVSHIKDALNYFMKARHVGKVVVSMPEMKESLGRILATNLLFNYDGTYLVTGGLGGIGLEVAKWMVNCGAKHMVLVGRKPPDKNGQKVLACFSSKGVQVLTQQVDIGNKEQCENLLSLIKTKMPPLRGVIHSAGVLSDGMITNQTWNKFETVFNAKVRGGWNLHQLTKDIPLEHFVFFSSLSAMIGNFGQSNHTAANMFLDSLIFHRHSLGLPAQTINWGAWSEVGVATNTSLGKEGALGLIPFTPSQGIAALQYAMSQPITQLGIVQTNFVEFIEANPVALAYLSELLEGNSTNDIQTGSQGEKFWNDVEQLNQEDRNIYVKKCIEGIIRQTLKIPESEAIDEHQTFSEMGLDSLMAVEMRNKLQLIFGKRLTLNPTSLLDYPTLIGLSKYLTSLTMNFDFKSSCCINTETDRKSIMELVSIDSVLPDYINICCDAVSPSNIKSILITGVTGHFGPYLLSHLVQNYKSVQIFCLVRAKTLESAEKKLKQTMKKFHLDFCLDQVTVILGNISSTNLGMSSEMYSKLANEIDALFHCAVKANHIEKYKNSKSDQDIRSVNVLGTIKILQFASSFKTKRVAFVSSYSAANIINDDGIVSENLPSDDNKGDGLEGGYPLTKFVCEKLMSQAIKRGIPCTVLRFPTLTGHSETGLFTTDANFIMNFLFTAARLKVFVDIPGGWNSIPVDVAAKISSLIFFNDQAEIGLYNVVGNQPMTSQEYGEIANEVGIDLRFVSQKEFIELLTADENPLLDIFREAVRGKDVVETVKGVSPAFRYAMENHKQVFKISRKLYSAVPGVEQMIPPPLQTMRRQFKFAITSGIFDQMGIQYQKHTF